MDYFNKNISINLKRIRKMKKMSLDAMAVETGISKSMLGQIERGEANPTITIVGKIVSGLRISFNDLICPPKDDFYVIRRTDLSPIKEIEGKFSNFAYFQYEDDRDFEIYSVDVLPGGAYACASHGEGTTEYLLVATGELALDVNGEVHVLHSGDAIRFSADKDHSYVNSGEGVLRIIMVFTWK